MNNTSTDKRIWDFHQDKNRSHLEGGYPRQNRVFKKIIQHSPNLGSSLEIGFGDGYLLNLLTKRGYKTYGQDLSEKNIENTRNQWNLEKTEFLLGDASGRLLAEDASVDIFIASEVLEHMDDNELSVCLDEIYRVLRKGGYAYITFPAREDLKLNECICPSCGEVFNKWGHKQYWDDKKISIIFDRFEIIEKQEFFNRFVGNSLIEKLLGLGMYMARNIINTFYDLEGKTYMLVLRKN